MVGEEHMKGRMQGKGRSGGTEGKGGNGRNGGTEGKGGTGRNGGTEGKGGRNGKFGKLGICMRCRAATAPSIIMPEKQTPITKLKIIHLSH